MSEQTQTAANVFEQVFDNLQKTAEMSMQMQQELFRNWSTQFPTIPAPQAEWAEQVRSFQKEWAETVTSLLKKNRKDLDHQYRTNIESLEEAFRLAESSDPEEFRNRAELVCRKSIECVKELAETQMREFQEAINKWLELAAKK